MCYIVLYYTVLLYSIEVQTGLRGGHAPQLGSRGQRSLGSLDHIVNCMTRMMKTLFIEISRKAS